MSQEAVVQQRIGSRAAAPVSVALLQVERVVSEPVVEPGLQQAAYQTEWAFAPPLQHHAKQEGASSGLTKGIVAEESYEGPL
jgi:hypothetical protein